MLAKEDGVAEVHTSIGVTMLYGEDDFEGAGRELRGLAVDPRYASLLRMAGLQELLDENAT